MTQENTTPQGDESAVWYNERRADAIRQVEQSLNDLETRYSTIEQSYQTAQQQEEQGHDYGDTRILVQAIQDKGRFEQEAAQISNAYSALQAEKQRLEQHSDPRLEELIANSSAPSQMFLRANRHKLENNPNALKQLLYADARAKAVGLKPDSDVYFRSLEAALGLGPDDRRTDDFFESDKPSNKPAKQEQRKETLSAEQLRFCKDSGIPEESYRAYAQNPFSQAHAPTTIEVEPSSFDSRSHKPMEISLDDEAPKKATVDASRYKPGPSSVNLSKTELDLIDNMAVQTGQSVKEARLEFAKQKHALMSGKAGHYQLYADKLASEGHY